MKHTRPIRFNRPLRTVRLADPNTLWATASPAAAATPVAADPRAEAAAAERQERQAVAGALAGLAEVAEGLANSRHALLGEMQKVAVELAVAVATRVTYDKLQSDRFAIEELVNAVISRLDAPGPVRVRMHPDDLALLGRRLGEGRLTELKDVQLVGDEALSRGDCTADAGDVTFSAILEEQLNGLRQHLLRSLSDAQIERRKAATGGRALRRFPDRRQTA